MGDLGVPESRAVRAAGLDGKDVVELGCGTAYISAWLAAAGRPPGRGRHHPGPARDRAGDAARVRARIPADRGGRGRDRPGRRLLRPRRLRVRRVDLGRSLPLDPGGGAAAAAGRRARLPAQLDARRSSARPTGTSRPASSSSGRCSGCTASTGWDGVEFHLAPRRLIRLLRANGFDILDLVELQAPPDAETDAYYDFVDRGLGAESGLRRRSGRRASGELAGRPAAPACVDEPAAARDPRPARDPLRRCRADVRRGGPAEGQRGPARARARPRQGALGCSAGRRSARARRRHRRLARREDLRQAGERDRRRAGCSRSSPARHTSSSPASA